MKTFSVVKIPHVIIFILYYYEKRSKKKSYISKKYIGINLTTVHKLFKYLNRDTVSQLF